MKKWILVLLVLVSGDVFANDLYVSVSDSIAGDDNFLSISGTLARETLQIRVNRPDETILSYEKTADEFGSVYFSVSGVHLRQLGNYKLSVVSSYFPSRLFTENFEVYPGSVSPFRSLIKIKHRAVPADGVAEAAFTVLLRDAFENPVSGKAVKVFSSRSSDKVIIGGVSDSTGKIEGMIKSDEPGVAILSVLTGDDLIFERPEVVFYLSGSNIPNVGSGDFPDLGKFLKAQLFSETFGTAAYFTIEELPSVVNTDEETSFLVDVKDENGELVRNYLGKIRFASTDDKAQLPVDYQFDLEDQGSHRFSLAVKFTTPGDHTLTVHDLTDFRIFGERKINVGGKEDGIDISMNQIIITSPQPGSYTLGRITIAGKAIGASVIKIIDGPTLLTENFPVEDGTGDFVYQTPLLGDGIHKFRIMSMDGSLKSEDLLIRIDRTPPSVVAIEVEPEEELDPGTSFTVRVTSSEPLSTVFCRFNENEVEFENMGGYFQEGFMAPMECGNHPLTCTVADLMGNEFIEPNAANIRVCKTGFDTDEDGVFDKNELGDDDKDGVANKYESDIIDSTGNGISDQQDPHNDSDMGGVSNIEEMEDETDPLNPSDDILPAIPPTAVSSLTTESGDKKVTLFWSPAKDDSEIWTYRVLFGKNEGNLDQEDKTPDNRTQWYVEDLEEAQRYYFQVAAIDIDGFEGIPSRIVEGYTFGWDEGGEGGVGGMRGSGSLEKSGTGGYKTGLIVLAVVLLVGIGVIIKKK